MEKYLHTHKNSSYASYMQYKCTNTGACACKSKDTELAHTQAKTQIEQGREQRHGNRRVTRVCAHTQAHRRTVALASSSMKLNISSICIFNELSVSTRENCSKIGSMEVDKTRSDPSASFFDASAWKNRLEFT